MFEPARPSASERCERISIPAPWPISWAMSCDIGVRRMAITAPRDTAKPVVKPTPLLVTSASGANGNGYGALLAFGRDGEPLGAFSSDARIADPRGLAVDAKERLLFLNSGADRVLALDRNGKVVRDSGMIERLNAGGGNFGPDGRYYVGLRSARTVMALSTALDAPGEHVVTPGIVPFPRGLAV